MLVGWSDYPATDWNLTFAMRGASNLSVSGAANGDDFDVVLTAVQTAALGPGPYQWFAKVTQISSGDVAVAESGNLSVLADLTNTTVGPWRARFNAAQEAMDEITAGGGVTSTNFNGQSFTTATLGELQRIIDRLEIKAIEEDRLLGLAPQGNLKRIRMSM